MKKLWIWALVLALLAGCTPTTPAPPEGPEQEPPAPVVETPPVEPAVTEEGWASRTEIIRRNEHTEGFFLTTRNWVQEYAERTWPDSEYALEYLSGFVAPEAMFTDFLSGGSALWSLTVSRTGGAALETSVQALYFQDGGEIWLSGLLEGDAVLSTRPEAFSYLRLDPRFSARMCDLPEIPQPVGLLAQYDLEALLGGPATVDALGRDLLAAYDLSGSGDRWIAVVKPSTGEVLQERALGEGQWSVTGVRDGVLTATRYDDEGGRTQVLYASAAGIEVRDLYPEAAFRWPMGENRFVESWENSLYEIRVDPATGAETRTLLLEGIYGEGEPDERFAFRQAIDDDQFIYDCWGYEWLVRGGVYDLSAGRDEYVAVPVTENGETRRQQCDVLWADRDAILAAVADYGYYAFSVTDREKGVTRLLELGYETYDQAAMIAVADPTGQRLLLCFEQRGETPQRVELYDLEGTLLWSWELNSAVAASLSVSMPSADTVAVQYFSLATGTYQLCIIEV